MTRSSATLVGFVAIMLWSLLALLTTASGTIPPFQLNAMTFTIGGLIGLWPVVRGRQSFASFRQPLSVWLLGVGGLFGYHFLYFTALRNAPPVDASLIAYLWPLLIVLFSALLPGERLRAHHVLGALLGLAGAGLIVTKGAGLVIQADYVFGYSVALVAAFVWSGYSVLTRRFSAVPTHVVAGFCFAAALLSLLCHLMLEETVWPRSAFEMLAVIGLGAGPLGLAFFAWDFGMKRGDVQVLGAGSYAAPLLSTLILVGFGLTEMTGVLALACLLITVGALWAAKDLLKGRSRV